MATVDLAPPGVSPGRALNAPDFDPDDGLVARITAVRLAELFGPVPMSRLALNGDFTGKDAEFVLRLADGEPRRLCELIEGIVLEKAMGTRESWIAVQLITFLNLFVKQHVLGEVLGADGMLRLQRNVFIPDVSYLSKERLPGGELPWSPGIATLVPDLAVEVISPSNTTRELETKRNAYFAAGVRQMWTIDPDAETVTVWTSVSDSATYAKGQTLVPGDILPGFQLPVAELFPQG